MAQAQVLMPRLIEANFEDSFSEDEEDGGEINEEESESLPDYQFDIKRCLWKSGSRKGEEKAGEGEAGGTLWIRRTEGGKGGVGKEAEEVKTRRVGRNGGSSTTAPTGKPLQGTGCNTKLLLLKNQHRLSWAPC